jgi:hypothetical protein
VNGTAAGDTDGLTVEGFQSKMHVHSAFSGLARQLIEGMSTVVCRFPCTTAGCLLVLFKEARARIHSRCGSTALLLRSRAVDRHARQPVKNIAADLF